MKKIKKLKLSKEVLGLLTSVEMGKAKGGKRSDSINTQFTKICECCKSGCPTSGSAY